MKWSSKTLVWMVLLCVWFIWFVSVFSRFWKLSEQYAYVNLPEYWDDYDLFLAYSELFMVCLIMGLCIFSGFLISINKDLKEWKNKKGDVIDGC